MKVQVLTNNAGGLYTDELLQAESYEGPSKDGPCVPPLRLRARLRLRLCLRDRCSRARPRWLRASALVCLRACLLRIYLRMVYRGGADRPVVRAHGVVRRHVRPPVATCCPRPVVGAACFRGDCRN